MYRLDIVFNVGLWIANAATWSYNGNMGMAVLSMLGVLTAVMAGRLVAN